MGGYFSSCRTLKNVIASIYKRTATWSPFTRSAILRVGVSGRCQTCSQVLSPSRRCVRTGRREPWERGWGGVRWQSTGLISNLQQQRFKVKIGRFAKSVCIKNTVKTMINLGYLPFANHWPFPPQKRKVFHSAPHKCYHPSVKIQDPVWLIETQCG